MTPPYVRTDGRVSYFLADGSEVGREWFSLHRHAQGRLVRATCEMNENALIRDAVWSLDSDWRPVDGYVHVMLDGRSAGSTWYGFDGPLVSCHARTPKYGTVTQARTSDRPYEFLGLHPLICDGLVTAVRGTDKPGEERWVNSITCSYAHDGATDLLALPIVIGVAYHGVERLVVKAGEFEARRYSVRWREGLSAATYWVWGDDYVFLKSTWDSSQLTCELTSMEITSQHS